MSLYEELTDERGDKYRHDLASALVDANAGAPVERICVGAGQRAAERHVISGNGERRQSAHRTGEIQDVLSGQRAFCSKPNRTTKLFLYYGNPRVPPPSYDLSLVAGQLLAADKTIASLVREEQLKKSSWRETQVPGQGGVLFWGILAVVVVVLLVIISRLLPKSQPPTN